MHTIIDRLRQYMEEKNINDNQITVGAGLSVGLIGKAKKANKGLNSDSIEKILHKYSDLDANWFLTGRGQMIKQKEQPMVSYKDTQEEIATAHPSDDGIPLIPLEAVAGFGTNNSIQVMEYESIKYVVPDFKGAEFLIQVKGNSMYPKYASGDIVACRKLPLDTFFQWNKVYVIDSEQGVLIKRIKPGMDDEHILLVSENEQYDPFSLCKNDIHALAIVIGVIRLE